MSELRTNQQRLWDAHMEMAVFGATPKGGMGRLALTDDDKKARDLFVDWSKQADCDVRIDLVGNIFARRKGTDPAAAPVISRSRPAGLRNHSLGAVPSQGQASEIPALRRQDQPRPIGPVSGGDRRVDQARARRDRSPRAGRTRRRTKGREHSDLRSQAFR